MINWDELKHIHVIRKLEAILAQWFNTDIFFVDEKGQIRNFDINKDSNEFKNPLSTAFFTKDRGRLLFSQAITEANEKVFKSSENHLILNGPAGIEKMFISRISVENEFLGSVVAYSYVESAITPEATTQTRTSLEAFGLEGEAFAMAISKLRVLSESEKKYFLELVDLVAQEIETFHTEITKREERINTLNNQPLF